jgi:ribosomal protein L7/L12
MEDLSMRISQLERLVEHLYTQLRVERPAPDASVSARVRELAFGGNKIGAIKLYREETGCDLKTAHAVIDRL